MGTTAEKLAYLNDTKAAIKNAIISKGADVPEGTTFRQYADLISGISTGLSDADLARANATPEDVTAGKTFFAGDSELRTGVALSTPITAAESDVKSGKTYYDENGVLKTGNRVLKVVELRQIGNIYLQYGKQYTESAPETWEFCTIEFIRSGLNYNSVVFNNPSFLNKQINNFYYRISLTAGNQITFGNFHNDLYTPIATLKFYGFE